MTTDAGDRSAASRELDAARGLFESLAETLDLNLSLRLWDGSRVPLGRDPSSPFEIVVGSAAVLSSLIRRPTRENLLLHYATGAVAIAGGDPLEFIRAAESGRGFKKLRRMPRWRTLKSALQVARVRPEHAGRASAFRGAASDSNFIRFHYDVGNDFYRLFLGEEMQYSCGVFENPDLDFDLDKAQDAKLAMICRNLGLERGERLLDVGCGWGGLLCYAARHFEVEAHGLTLSRAQHDFAQQKIRRLGLEGQVTVELIDYAAFASQERGGYDRIASIEMIEHIGLANYPSFLRKMRSLLRDRGRLLIQATTRRAKRTPKRSRRLTAGSRLMERYVFPGFELDHVGNTVARLEAARFEVHQVLGLRTHYARTTEIWCRRLWERRAEAEAMVGEERTRLWLAYLAGVATAFQAGSLCVYQVVSSKQGMRERSRLAAAAATARQEASKSS